MFDMDEGMKVAMIGW